MSYISLSEEDKKEMLGKIGVGSIEELFKSIPEKLRLKKELNVPPPLREPELLQHFQSLAEENKYQEFLSFLGAGAYRHFIPSSVDYLSTRGEFLSPYTPYQPEISQGTLQTIFEFQTLICQLTGMEISNASLYDGASSVAEAVLMANRIIGRSKVILSSVLHPEYRATVRTYARNLGLIVEEVGYGREGTVSLEELKESLDEKTCAFVVQSPNFFGEIEDVSTVSELAHGMGALSVVVVTDPVSLGVLEAPGKLGADIVCGEGQALGMPLSFGGPSLGFMACAKQFLRQFPGRIAGETKDADGKKGYVLTLSTREQHIRRERATSNICTNQAWCALRATIFLECLGKRGLREMAWQNIQKAHFALEKMVAIGGIRQKFGGKFFNEFVVEFPQKYEDIQHELREKGIIGGLDLEKFYPELKNCALFCVTEVYKREDIERLEEALREILKKERGRGKND